MDGPEHQPGASDNPLESARVLVVEDSPVVADAAEDMLRGMGCLVVGPATTMAAALQMAGEEAIDAAVVDINIRGGKAFPVLKILHGRGIPFLLTSGYADWTMPEEWRQEPRLPKPYTPASLRDSLARLLAERTGRL